MDDLLAFAAQRDIPLAVGNPVDSLIVEDGAVMGAVIGGEPVRARKTLLATNGFAGNRDMVARFCPEIAPADYFGALGSTGEAVAWGEALGAALGNMGAYQGYAAVAYPQGSLLSWTTIEKGGVLVSETGRRLGTRMPVFRLCTRRHGPGRLRVGGDKRIHEIACLEEEYAEMAEMGALKWADTRPTSPPPPDSTRLA